MFSNRWRPFYFPHWRKQHVSVTSARLNINSLCRLLEMKLSWCTKPRPSAATNSLKQTSESSLYLSHTCLMCSETLNLFDSVSSWTVAHNEHMKSFKFHFLPLEENDGSMTSWWIVSFVQAACGIRQFHVVARLPCSCCFRALQQLAQSPITVTVWSGCSVGVCMWNTEPRDVCDCRCERETPRDII